MLGESVSTGFPLSPPFIPQRAKCINLLASHIVFVGKKAFEKRFLGNDVPDGAGKNPDIG
jgi:hypothetical protein